MKSIKKLPKNYELALQVKINTKLTDIEKINLIEQYLYMAKTIGFEQKKPKKFHTVTAHMKGL